MLPVPSVYMQHLPHSDLKISALCLGEVEVEFFPVMTGSRQIELLKGFARYGPSLTILVIVDTTVTLVLYIVGQ